jgi:hypothetical protein
MCTFRGFNSRHQLALLGSAIWEEGLAVENAAERGAVPIMPNDPNAELVEVQGELKKMNKQLRQLIELKKQANLMVGYFFCCIIAIGFLSLLIRRYIPNYIP